jgi:hypothetical protein
VFVELPEIFLAGPDLQKNKNIPHHISGVNLRMKNPIITRNHESEEVVSSGIFYKTSERRISEQFTDF